MTEELARRLERLFPQIAEAPTAFREELMCAAALQRAPAGFEVCGEGQACTALAMLLAGEVRVSKVAASGREITLYRIHPGDSCVLTTSCILSGSPFPARAVTETPVEALFVPADRVSAWLDVHAAWRRLVFGLVAKRLGAVISLVEEVAFRRLDERLARLLLGMQRDGAGELSVTHQRLAAELGTSREVVTRVLREFERQGWVETGRGRIRILQAQALASVADGTPV